MLNYCNTATQFFCCHGGKCEPAAAAHGVGKGCSDAVTAKMLLDGTITGCPVPPPGVACTKVTQVLTGTASGYDVGGSPPLLTSVVALTNGGPPGVVTASGPVGSCVLSAGVARTAPRHPAAGSTPTVPPKKPLRFSLRIDGPFLAAHGVARGWLPDGVTVTVVQPGKPDYWQTQFVRLPPDGVPVVVETKLPADRDTFVVITSHPGVNDVGMLELADAPPPLVGLGKRTDVKPIAEWKGAARGYADVIAAAPKKDGLTAAVVARANLPWIEPHSEVPVGVVLRPPQRIVGAASPELLLRPAYPELLALHAALDMAEPLIHEKERYTQGAKLVERMGLAAFCRHAAESENVAFEKSFAPLSQVAPKGSTVHSNDFPHLRKVPPSKTHAILGDQLVHDFALGVHAERTKALAAEVLGALGVPRRLFGSDATTATPLATDHHKFVCTSPLFLGTVELTDDVPPAVVEAYFHRTTENEAARLIDRGLEAADRGLNLLFELQSVLDEGERPVPAADVTAWTDWMVGAIARWECAGSGAEPQPPDPGDPYEAFPPGSLNEPPVDLETGAVGAWQCRIPKTRQKPAEEHLKLGEPFKTPARGLPLVIKQTNDLASKGWKFVSQKQSFRLRVGTQRDRIMRWAALKPDSKLWGRLLSLTAPAERLAAELSLKNLSTLGSHANVQAELDKIVGGHLTSAAKARDNGLMLAGNAHERMAHGANISARRLDSAQQAQVRAAGMRWLLGPLVVLHVLNRALDPKAAINPHDPFAIQVLRQASAVGTVVQMVTGTVQAGITAKRLELTGALRSLPMSEAERAAMRAELRLYNAANRGLAKFAGRLSTALQVIQVVTALGDAWADWRHGHREAAGLEVLNALLPVGLALIPGVGPILAVAYAFVIGPLIDRWIAQAKVSPDDTALHELFLKTEFGRTGAGRSVLGELPLKEWKGAYAEALYAGRCGGSATVHDSDIRSHLYLRQWKVWTARVPSGAACAPGQAAGLGVQITPLPGQCRFLRARLHPAAPLNGLPSRADLTADAVSVIRKDGSPGFQVSVNVSVLYLGPAVRPARAAPSPDVIGGLSPQKPVAVTVRALDCVCRDAQQFPGRRVPALLNLDREPVFFVDPALYGGGSLTIKEIEIAAGGSVWLVFGPAPSAQGPYDVRVPVCEYPKTSALDVLPPGPIEDEPPTKRPARKKKQHGADKPLGKRLAPDKLFLSIQAKPSALTTLGVSTGAALVLDTEVLDRALLQCGRPEKPGT